VHLLEAVFYATPGSDRSSLALEDGWKYRKSRTTSASVLSTLVSGFQAGVAQLYVLATPHLVVLHTDFYEKFLKHQFAVWGMLFFVPWLRKEIDFTEPPSREQHPALFTAWHELEKLEELYGRKQLQAQLTEFVSGRVRVKGGVTVWWAVAGRWQGGL
jgi:hypothetical protein